MTEDPFWELYFKPSTGIRSAGKAIHGIAIPANVSKLYRTSAPDGEYYYTDSSDENFITESNNLPSWITTNDEWKSLLYFRGKHSALLNTCCHVYCNAGRGKSFETLPFLFFVEDALKKPSLGESNEMKDSSYEQFHTSFDAADNGLNARSVDGGSLTGEYMTPWVLPTVHDFNSIFIGKVPTNVVNTNDSPDVVERCKVFSRSTRVLGGSGQTYDGIRWWLSNENPFQHGLCQGNITNNGNVFFVYYTVEHTTRAYVLPIRYF